MSTAQAVPTLPPEIYGTFSDGINQGSVQRIFNSVAIAMNGGVKHAHILFQSAGGSVSDGIALYNFFRTTPLRITLYNSGAVQSIAVVAFVGAKHRKTSRFGTFYLHSVTGPQIAGTAVQLEAILESVKLDDLRIEAILRQHIQLPEIRWPEVRTAGSTINADDAVKYGLANEVGDFDPPPDARVFNI